MTDEHENFILLFPVIFENTWKIPNHLGLIESRTFAKEERILSTFRGFSMTYKVSVKDEVVNVKAGILAGCLIVVGAGKVSVPVDRHNDNTEVEIRSVDRYAPGIGLIKSERVEKYRKCFSLSRTLYS